LVASREAGVLGDAVVRRVRDAVGGATAHWLSPGEAVDLQRSERPSLDVARAATGEAPIDVLLTRGRGRRRGLLVADMDSTVVTTETLDELAVFAGVGERIAEITRASMNGQINFAEALRARVALLRGLDLSALEATWQATRLTPGARTLVATMRAHNALTALVSGGFSFFTDRVAAQCGFERTQANVLLDDGAALTGEVAEPVMDRDAKRTALNRFAAERGLKPAATLAVGDGANDLAMLREAGLGIAFHAKPVVTAEIPNRVDHADLRALLFAQGYPASVFRDD
jgi:phosphoserine phosphatase